MTDPSTCGFKLYPKKSLGMGECMRGEVGVEITLGRYFLPTVPRLWWVWGRGVGGRGGGDGVWGVWGRGGREGSLTELGPSVSLQDLCFPQEGSLPPALQPSPPGLSQDHLTSTPSGGQHPVW